MDETKHTRSLPYYMRALHRVLGYLALGMVVVYTLSGIILIYRTGNFMKRAEHIERTIEPGLDASQLGDALQLRRLKIAGETDTLITFADGGSYSPVTGRAEYVTREVVFPFNKFIELHMLPTSKNAGVGVITTIFGAVLLLLALTSLFMFKPHTPQFGRNMLYTAAGVALAIILLAVL